MNDTINREECNGCILENKRHRCSDIGRCIHDYDYTTFKYKVTYRTCVHDEQIIKSFTMCVPEDEEIASMCSERGVEPEVIDNMKDYVRKSAISYFKQIHGWDEDAYEILDIAYVGNLEYCESESLDDEEV